MLSAIEAIREESESRNVRNSQSAFPPIFHMIHTEKR